MNEITKLNLKFVCMYVLRMIAQRIRHNTLGALVFFGRQWKYIKADEQTRQFVALAW